MITTRAHADFRAAGHIRHAVMVTAFILLAGLQVTDAHAKSPFQAA